MPHLALALAFAAGVGARATGSSTFALLFRGQLVVLSSALALLAGWSVSLSGRALGGVAVLVLAEVAAVTAGAALLRRGLLSPPVVASSASNSGFWSIPVAAALFGPPGAAFAVFYDVVTVPRALLVVHTLRGHASVAPSRRSAVTDYLPQVSLVVGLILRQYLPQPGIVSSLPALGLVVGTVGFLLLGMAMPLQLPRLSHFRAALPVVPLRFGVASAACLLAKAAGLELPAAAWVLALAPSPFIVVSLSRLYGYGREDAAAIPLLTVPVAVALLPVVIWAG